MTAGKLSAEEPFSRDLVEQKLLGRCRRSPTFSATRCDRTCSGSISAMMRLRPAISNPWRMIAAAASDAYPCPHAVCTKRQPDLDLGTDCVAREQRHPA